MIGPELGACFVYKQLRYRYEHSKLVTELDVRISGRSRSTVSGKPNVDFLYVEKILLQEIMILFSEMLLGSRNATDTGLEICSLDRAGKG